MGVSVIIPVLNEVSRIGPCLEALSHQPDIDECIVVDGGSSDGTSMRAQQCGARVLQTRRGRGHQLNAGAAAASGDMLLFLHVDALLPPNAADWVMRTLAVPGVVGGAFRVRHRPEKWDGRWRAHLLRLADIRSHYTELPYGDQGIFIRAWIFAEVGGFPEIELMEDLAFSRKLRGYGRIRIAPAEVQVSGRRFETAPLYQTVLVNVFPALFALGISPQTLAQWYGNPR